MTESMQKKGWSDPSLLKSLKNPSQKEYIIVMTNPEVTFLGVPNQPDFAVITIEFTPDQKIIELKSLKEYFVDFRQRVLSYERLINVVFDDLLEVFEPKHLRVTVNCNPRGGISSELVADSRLRQ
jgi:7-cyano-7-deazaguanine reductase